MMKLNYIHLLLGRLFRPFQVLGWVGNGILAVLLLMLHPTGGRAQVDPHFSQYYLQPMSLNPALTGAIDGDYRVAGIFRSQYANTLISKGASAEVVSNKHTNFGLQVLNQTTNDQSYNLTNGYLSMAYNGARFGKEGNHVISMALECGFINRRFDVSKLQFGSQWISGTGYTASNSSGESFVKPSVFSFDAGAGIAYFDNTPGKKVNIFGGIAAFHLTRPNNPYLSNGNTDRMDMRLSIQAGARIKGSDSWTLVPTMLYMKQGWAEEKMLGAYFQVYASVNTDFMAGLNYRFKDAVIPFAGFFYKGLTVGMSYDANANAASNIAVKRNSLELSISFVGIRKSHIATNNFSCPRF